MSDKVHKTWKSCKVPVCERVAWSRGYCAAHYQKQRIHGYVPNTPIAVFAPKGMKPQCSIPDCERTAHAHGICHTHYTQDLRRLKRSLGYTK